MKKRIWSLLLALAMVTSLVPAALAAEDGTKEDETKELSQETLAEIAKADESTSTTRYWELTAGNYQLTGDIVLDDTIDDATYISLRFNGESTLDVNGHSITSSNMAVITNQGTLTIKDSSGDETGCVTGSRGVDNYGSLTLESGTIHGTGTSATIQFRGNSQNASFTMRGGSVTSAQANAVGYSVDYNTNTVTTITLIGGSVGNILLNGAPTLIVGEESSSPIDHSKITVGKITRNWSTGTVTLKLNSGLIEELPTYRNTVTYATDTIGALIKEPRNAPPLYHFIKSGVENYPNYYKLEKDADASPVASIDDKQYYYLPTAVAALKKGDTLKLLANYNITNSSEALMITVPNVTLDLNGHNITSSAAANPVSYRGDASGTFTITNSSTDITSFIQSSSNTISDVSVGSNSSVTLEIEENVTVGTVGLNSGARMKDTDENRVLAAPDGNYDNLYAVTLGDEKYIYGGSDLSAIGIDAAAAGTETVTATLLGDATDGISYGNSGVPLTVDLGGYMVTGTGNTAVGIPSGAGGTSLTVRNGTVHGAISAAGASSTNCTLTLEDLTMTSNGDAGIGANGALSDGLKLKLKGCTLTSNNTSNMTTGIFFPVENGVLTIEDSTIDGYNTGVQAYAGSVTITGEETVITGSGVSVPNLDDETGNLMTTGPIFDGAAVSIIDRNTDYGELTSVKIEGGSFRTDASDAKHGAVHVASEVEGNPGTFEEFDNTSSSGGGKIVQVSGGAFTSSVKEYVTNNLKAELYSTGNGTYTYYDSKESANNAAKPGDAVSNVTSTVSYSVTVVYGNGTATQTFTMSDNATYILPTAPTRPDYTFLGWSDGTTTYQAGKTVTITGATTFTARWAYNGGGSSSGGSSSGSNRYTVSVDDDIDNGSIRISPSRAERGDTVTITIDPDEGYELDSLTVRDSRGNRIDVERQSDTRYTFEMPSGRVTVDATFTEVAETPETPDQIGSFTDVDTDDWFADAVQYMLDNGMMNGVTDTTFGPGTTTTRGMIVTILYRLEGEPDAAASSFTDAASGMYYADAVAWAQANSIVTGITETIFAPDQAITREQMAAILYRYAQYKGYDVTASNDLSSYTDASRISAYATTAMQWANAEGLITGNTSTTINPTGNATRAEVATILMRFCETVTK